MNYGLFLRAAVDLDNWPEGYPYVAMTGANIHFYKHKPNLVKERVKVTSTYGYSTYHWEGDRSGLYQECELTHPMASEVVMTKEELMTFCPEKARVAFQALSKQEAEEENYDNAQAIITAMSIMLLIPSVILCCYLWG